MPDTTARTPGEWQLDSGDKGEPMTRDHPGEPGYLPYVYVTLPPDYEVRIAEILEPTYHLEADHIPPDNEYDEGERRHGDWEANAEFICRAVNSHDALLEALQFAAAPNGPYSRDPVQYRDNVLEEIRVKAQAAIAAATKEA